MFSGVCSGCKWYCGAGTLALVLNCLLLRHFYHLFWECWFSTFSFSHHNCCFLTVLITTMRLWDLVNTAIRVWKLVIYQPYGNIYLLYFSRPFFDWFLVLEMKLAIGFVLIFSICKQANEVVKANNLAEKVIVLHGRVEVGFSSQAYWCVCSLNGCKNTHFYILMVLICSHIWEKNKLLYILTFGQGWGRGVEPPDLEPSLEG